MKRLLTLSISLCLSYPLFAFDVAAARAVLDEQQQNLTENKNYLAARNAKDIETAFLKTEKNKARVYAESTATIILYYKKYTKEKWGKAELVASEDVVCTGVLLHKNKLLTARSCFDAPAWYIPDKQEKNIIYDKVYGRINFKNDRGFATTNFIGWYENAAGQKLNPAAMLVIIPLSKDMPGGKPARALTAVCENDNLRNMFAFFKGNRNFDYISEDKAVVVNAEWENGASYFTLSNAPQTIRPGDPVFYKGMLIGVNTGKESAHIVPITQTLIEKPRIIFTEF